MNERISKIIGQWQGADGALAEVVFSGEGRFGPESWAAVDELTKPLIKLDKILVLTDGSRIALPVSEIPELLPDHSGVLVVFNEKAKGAASRNFMQIPPPNNAAIFNADGSLRFQLQNPWGDAGSFRAVLSNHRPDGAVELGVRACPRDWPVCESVYIVDGSTPEIGKQLPRWVRD